MSVVKEIFLMCDGCHRNFGIDNRHRTVYEHRKAARKEGWKFTMHRDLCESCVKNSQPKP